LVGIAFALLNDMKTLVRCSIASIAALVLVAVATGCASSPVEPVGAAGDFPSVAVDPSEDQGDDNVGDVGNDSSQGFAAGCGSNRDDIIASAPSAARKTILERGFNWLDQGVRYSQSRNFGGYRTDCSGFVSMAWGLKTSQSTRSFGGGADATRLSSQGDLLPGDALVQPGRHAVLFLANQGDSICVLEQASTKSDMQFRLKSKASLSGFIPMRRENDPGGTSASGPAPSSGCRSKTINKTVGRGVCVQNTDNQKWYQCTGSIWRFATETEGPAGACTETFGL
jgi:hypothetical protein